jgi:hypothetical protein
VLHHDCRLCLVRLRNATIPASLLHRRVLSVFGVDRPFVREALEAASKVEGSGKALSLNALTDAGLSPAALERVMLAEFPDQAEVPYALGVGSFGEAPSSVLYLKTSE